MLKNEHEYKHAIELIQAEMDNLGISQNELSVRTKIEKNIIARCLAFDRTSFTAEELCKICGKLNLDILFVVLKRKK